MPKVARELSAIQVRRLSRPGLHAVGGVAGLNLRVGESGAKYWVLRIRVGGRRRDIGIGPFPEISLAEARVEAASIRKRVRAGADPIAERQAERAAALDALARSITFDRIAERYIDSKAAGFRSRKHLQQWRSTLDQYASPVLGTLEVDRIELPHILEVLQPIWNNRTETASRLRGRIEKVLDYATVSGHRSGENPARWRGNLDAILPAPGKVKTVRHFRALPWKDAPAFMANLSRQDGIAAQALAFTILTAARSGEVRHATWDEIDGARWLVPAGRMKSRRPHMVPLSAPALAILENLPQFEGVPYIFPGVRGGPLSDMSVSAVLRRMEIPATVHGFRSTFRDWVAEQTDYPNEVAEMALAHVVPGKVERAYRRGNLFEKRAGLMAEWAEFLGGAHHDD